MKREYINITQIENIFDFHFYNGVLLGTAYMEIDGEYVINFASNQGAWADYVLIEIGKKLKEINDKYGIKIEE